MLVMAANFGLAGLVRLRQAKRCPDRLRAEHLQQAAISPISFSRPGPPSVAAGEARA
jgi:hypothetical protein